MAHAFLGDSLWPRHGNVCRCEELCLVFSLLFGLNTLVINFRLGFRELYAVGIREASSIFCSAGGVELTQLDVMLFPLDEEQGVLDAPKGIDIDGGWFRRWLSGAGRGSGACSPTFGNAG